VENVFRLNAVTGQFDPAPLDLATGQNHTLVLNLTGVRNRTSLASVSVGVGSVTLSALYAGPVASFPGLDQINVAVPASLRGSGTQSLSVTVDGYPSPAGVSLLFN